ncbi:FAD-dependent oxidoreductase [Aerococcus tenax]|uniref:FAD-dependent oxidoreductase n=1 Tax=Aerococcus tenax TaxID=3078812 RepID=UPI0018A728C3|nr:FAD-dependent oxidoreductase [Aerococcus tenax]
MTKGLFEPGSYSVRAAGHNGSLPMEVTLTDDRIKSIEIDTSGESKGITSPVFERIPKAIIEGQTLNVDTVSGATVTSKGILAGVADAIEAAGGDPEEFRNRPKYQADQADSPDEKSADVVVLGSGGAGLSAAIGAVDKGAKVILLEKFPSLGGNTTRTGGQINSADPEWQKGFDAFPGEVNNLKGIYQMDEADIPEAYRPQFRELKAELEKYFADMENGENYLFDSENLFCIQTLLGGTRKDLDGNVTYGNYDLVSNLTHKGRQTIEWMKTKGVEFDEEHVTEPVGASWRRAREPIPTGGYGFIDPLQKYFTHQGGEIITDCQAKELLVEDGKIVGVKAQYSNGNDLTVHAKSGVVMATGGYSANYEMVKKYDNYWGNLPETIPTTNSPALTGDGIAMGLSVNAALVDMGFAQLMPSADPITGNIFSGIDCPPSDFVFVNLEGKRFVNEYGTRDQLCQAIFDQGGLIYNISDKNIAATRFNSTDEQLENDIKNDACFRADTLEELAEQINIDPEVLVDTIEKYNQYVEDGHDPEFNKGSFNYKVEVPPFYATPRSPATHHTMGGLKINVNAQVINEAGEAIDGLFAAGEVAGGIHAGNRLGGNALIDIFTYGRIAGENAASNR